MGAESDFLHDRCPRCMALVQSTTPRQERCKECGYRMESGQWTCPNCGHTQWGIILGLGGFALLCIGFAVVFLPLPTVWTLLVGGLGVVLFYSAFYGIGGALRWRGLTTFATTTFMLVLITLAALAARYRYSPDQVIVQTPDAIVVAAAFTETPQPTSTAAPTFTPAPTATPSITALVNAAMVNVRSGPGVDFAVLAGVKQDESIILLGRNADGSWLKMKTAADQMGWVSSPYITLPVDLMSIPEVPPDPVPTP
jgi:hypothetical protein